MTIETNDGIGLFNCWYLHMNELPGIHLQSVEA